MGQDSISFWDSVSSKKLGTGKADLPALSEALSDKQYKQSFEYDAPTETLASEIQLLNEVPSDPIRSHQQSLVQLPGRKNSLPSCTPAMGTSLDKGVITVQLICHLKSNGFSEAFDLSLPEHQLPSKFDHPLRVKSTSPDFSK